jgi:pilus assembly protein CpaE
VTNDSALTHRVEVAVSGGLAGTLHSSEKVALPQNPHDLLLSDAAGERAEVLLFGPGVALEEAFRLAAAFDIQFPEISIVLVAEVDPEATLSAMRAGIRDIVDPNADPQTIRVVLERAGRAAEGRSRVSRSGDEATIDLARVIVVASPKGGVGKTTVATNLAVALGRIAPMSTVLVDLDAQFGDVASAMQLQPEHTLVDAVTGAAKQDSMVLKAFLTVHQSSIYALCAPNVPEEADRISADDVSRLIEQLAREFRYVVLDTEPGLGEHTLVALEHATDAVLICTKDVPAVRGLRKEIDVLNQLGLSGGNRRVVVNFGGETGLSIRDIEATIGLPVDLVIPRSKEIALSTNLGVPLLQGKTKGPAVRAINRLASSFDPAAPVKVRGGAHKRAESK